MHHVVWYCSLHATDPVALKTSGRNTYLLRVRYPEAPKKLLGEVGVGVDLVLIGHAAGRRGL